MYLRIGDLKLLKIKVRKDGNIIYDGMVEEAPDEIKDTNYTAATFDSEYIIRTVERALDGEQIETILL